MRIPAIHPSILSHASIQTQMPIHSSIQSFIHAFTPPPMHAPIRTSIHACIHSSRPSMHPCTHASTIFPSIPPSYSIYLLIIYRSTHPSTNISIKPSVAKRTIVRLILIHLANTTQIVRALEGDSSLEDLNEGVRPGQSMPFGNSNEGSDYDSSSYASRMRKIQRVALASQEFNSSEYGATSEYGLNPSASSSGGESGELGAGGRGIRGRSNP